jgi:hypothetical protein
MKQLDMIYNSATGHLEIIDGDQRIGYVPTQHMRYQLDPGAGTFDLTLRTPVLCHSAVSRNITRQLLGD